VSIEHPHSDIAHVLRLAFGREVPAIPIPVAPGQSEYGMAFALHGPRVPPRVLLLRYSPQNRTRAFRAFMAMQALHDRNFPVPDVYYLGWSYYTRYVLMLVEYIEGRSMEDQPHAFFARIGPDFAHTLAYLHRLPWEPFPDLAVTPLPYAFHELASLVRRLETWQLQEILGWLAERVRQIRELPHTVIHGDYSLQNVLAEHTRVVAVQGWEQAVIADPRLDVGYTSAMLGAYGVALSDQFLEAYTAVAGPVLDCEFWEVFGALRLLARVARTLSTLRPPQRDRFLARVGPHWQGLLAFVANRSGLDLR
jgi:aminoglycoside phosphotransferase (APT) family kinase protein